MIGNRYVSYESLNATKLWPANYLQDADTAFEYSSSGTLSTHKG